MRRNSLVVRACQAIAAVALVSLPLTASAQDRDDVLFSQKDVTIQFNLDFAGTPPALIGGHGVEAGFASGAITGTTLTNFQFRGLSLDNRVGITDLDGDRIIFRKSGTGTFLPPLNDPSSAPDFQVFGATATDIILSGTYKVVEATGKFAKKFQVGDEFPFVSIASNPNWPPATAPAPGTIVPGTEYVEVYRNKR